MVDCLKTMAATIERPSAMVVVSAHWEAPYPTITSGSNPALIYDYNGFPKESYEIQYPCPGAPDLAKVIAECLIQAGFSAYLNDTRGFDHGLFVPLKMMYPSADIPCVQISLIKSLDPAAHIQLGRALQGLSDPSILVIGSGFSFHNMQAFFRSEASDEKAMNQAFEDWLIDTCSNLNLTEEERHQRLIQWDSAPSARYCHPREEHLIPLHVCYGFAESACTQTYALNILNKRASMYLWEVTG
ncbi:extradiol ring-cleavage dioxygenase [Leptolyngbya sp. BL0902]|uniref:DODA-type extradiol aromatic ring-opening family dioxygenase n=1 Tax=Leptolyngbya sp. BL0902 TaxID=1115757 RepID=UPI001934D5A2|nr:extradiol ring-cleavage dioxygenase [Leptolyngbya sp. BL0902]